MDDGPGGTSPVMTHVSVDESYDTDDSGYEDVASLTQSVTSSIYDYKFENGRRYHAYKAGSYYAPNDEKEQDRMDMQYRAMNLAIGDRHFLAPVKEPQRIIDLGTGTGIWAMEVADQFPGAEVIGTDLSPIQPQWVPPNVKFEVDDVEDDWTWPADHFDYIHERLLFAGCVADFPKLFQQAYKHCKPGGYFEVQEMHVDLKSDDYIFPEDSNAQKWCALMADGIEKMGRLMILDYERLANTMREAGFVDVVKHDFKVPVGQWPANRMLKEAGAMQLVSLLEGIDSLSMAVFSRVHGWQELELVVFMAKVRREFCNRRAHLYWPGAIIYGRKPES